MGRDIGAEVISTALALVVVLLFAVALVVGPRNGNHTCGLTAVNITLTAAGRTGQTALTVVAAAVILDPECYIPGIGDSKVVPAAERALQRIEAHRRADLGGEGVAR